MLKLDKNHIIMHYEKYNSFENFFQSFIDIVIVFGYLFPQAQFKRLGLRYINEIELSGSPFIWKQLINSKSTSSINFVEDKNILSRMFNSLDLYFKDYRIKFQYGMHNPDFPSPIKKKYFVLDYDAVEDGLLSIEEVKSEIPVFHDKIQELFELSIEKKLRDFLNG
jgi:uncharacterized protein (TIGR04255 family)